MSQSWRAEEVFARNEPARSRATSTTMSPPFEQAWRRFREGCYALCASLLALWLLFYALYPYVRNGAETIALVKTDYLESHEVFSPNSRARLLVFGNSKILAGFNPAIYDDLLGGATESFNAGLPGNNRFIGLLKRILANGTRPTHILVLTPPTDERELTWLDYWQHDNLTANLLFPFRYLPRDLALFLASSPRNGGIVNAYRKNAQATANVIADRGYYFIEGQSHFQGDALPDDYRLPTDSPAIVPPRIIDPKAPAFKELITLSDSYGFKVIFIPTPYRIGEVAPPGAIQPDIPTQLDSVPNFYIAGPPRLVFEPRYFSDSVHLNREGAAVYSRYLAECTSSIIKQ